MILLKPLFYFILVTTIGVLTSVTLIPIFGEGLEWKTSKVMTGPSPSNPAGINQTFNIQYRIFNGTGTFQIIHDYMFTANIYSKTNDMFEIQIPRDFPYYNGKDGPSSAETYVVIENGGQITPSEYAKTTSDCFFTYSVPSYKNSTITILSTDTLSLMTPIYGDKVPGHCLLSATAIPEFPYALPVLVTSIASLILLYRIKFKTSI